MIKLGKVLDNKSKKTSSILDAAYELFTSKSFNNTSIDDVVKKAGIAKGTFYLYFRDKYDLLERLVINKSSSVFRDCMDKLNVENSKGEMTFAEQVVFLSDCVINYMLENKSIIFLLEKKLSSCFKAVSREEDTQLKHDVDELIMKNVSNGYTFEETLKQLYIIIDMVGSVCCDAILHETPYGIDDIKPELFKSIKKIVS